MATSVKHPSANNIENNLSQYVVGNSKFFFSLEMYEMYAGIYDKTISIIFVKTCLQGGSRSTERTIEDLEVFWVTLREFS